MRRGGQGEEGKARSGGGPLSALLTCFQCKQERDDRRPVTPNGQFPISGVTVTTSFTALPKPGGKRAGDSGVLRSKGSQQVPSSVASSRVGVATDSGESVTTPVQKRLLPAEGESSPRTPRTPITSDAPASPADSTSTSRSIKLVVGSRSQKHEEQDRFQEQWSPASSLNSRANSLDERLVRLKQALWPTESVGNLYVFKGSTVPALLEIFTSPICEDYARLRRWVGLWFSTPGGADTVAPPMVPLVYHVTDQGDGLSERLGRNEYTKRRNSYQRQWALEAEQAMQYGEGGRAPSVFSGHGTCYAINGEYVPLRELEKMDASSYHTSKSKGVLKVLLADETTLLATYQPMESIKAMVGNLVANVAVVGCGAKCTCHGHEPHRSDTHHSIVLAMHQVPLVKQECESYHVAGVTLSHPNASGMESLGVVVWVTHGFIDSTPMAVGYCGLASPN